MLSKPTPINNYQLLDLLGLIEPVGVYVKLSNQALVLKDDIPIVGLPVNKVFPLDMILKEKVFKKEELWATLQNLPYLKHLRVFFGKFRPDKSGIVTQRVELWDSIKAWRYDIDVVKDEDLINDYEEAIQKINNKSRDLQELIQKLPLPPNVIKRSNKGWHLIYVFKEFITREAYETYLKQYNNPNNRASDYPISDQFIVYELLSKYIPRYIAELEPQLDIQASSKVSSIATRFVTEDLPAYIIHRLYTLNEFRKAFEFLLVEDKEEIVYKQGKTPYTVKDIPKTTFLSLMDRCAVLKALDEDWEDHDNFAWYVMTNYYAIRILYAETTEEAEKLRQEFHEKSSRWKGNGNKYYTYNEAERQLEYYIRKQEEGLKPPTCKYIYNNLDSKYTTICRSCPYRRFDSNGNMIANFVFDALRSDSLEDVKIPGWELRDDGWYMEVRGKDGLDSTWVRVLPFFRIRAHYIVGKDEVELIDIVDKNGVSEIKPVERRGDTYLVNPEIIKKYGRINRSWISAAKGFLVDYIEEVKERKGVVINFLGYEYVDNVWRIAVGGYGNYQRKDLGYIFYGDEISRRWFVPSVKGDLETFKNVYKDVFKLNDPALHLAIAHFLSWIGEQYLDNEGLKANINPILIFIGDSGTGKSVRAKIAASLYGNPSLFSFTNVTQASYNNKFPSVKAPIVIDEVSTRLPKYEEKLAELLYNVGNRSGKMTAYTTYNPIETPVLLIGETQNFLVDKLFSSYRGLARRSIVIRMTTQWRDNSEELDRLLNQLYRSYGHILSYVKSLKPNDRVDIEESIQDIYTRIKVGGNIFKEVKEHLALSLSMFKHFYVNFIGVSENDLDEKIEQVLRFATKEISEHQLDKIGDTVDYIEEIIEFISAVIKAKKEGASLRGMTYKALLGKIDYKPTDKVEPILKKFFWKKYKTKTGTNYRFRDDALLLESSLGQWNNVGQREEMEMLLQDDFKREDFELWLKLVEIRFGTSSLYDIRERFRYYYDAKRLYEKFPELDPKKYDRLGDDHEDYEEVKKEEKEIRTIQFKG